MKKYLAEDYDLGKAADVLDELSLWSAAFGMKMLEHIMYKPGITAVDIGFGTGFPMIELAMRLGESSTVYGIDPWKEAADRARKKIEAYGVKNIRIIEGYAEEIPLENDSVELIVSNNGMNNVKDAEKVLKECWRILKPGGQFVMTMNLDRTMIEFYDLMAEVLDKLKLYKTVDAMWRHISDKRIPESMMIDRIEGNGFIIKDIEHDKFNFRFADGTSMLNHYFIRLAFMGEWMKFIPIERRDEIYNTLEAELNTISKRDGGLKLSVPYVMIDSRRNG